MGDDDNKSLLHHQDNHHIHMYYNTTSMSFTVNPVEPPERPILYDAGRSRLRAMSQYNGC